ncbi:MAG TPA: hypothetical protein VKU02_08300 [Gemmataceae bacterium]|nr:hypothetical protein [Gemmataceae bacterium]
MDSHASGQWARRIRGRLSYFGPWEDPDGALKRYLEQKDALHAGRKPRPDPEGLTIKDAGHAFLNHAQALVNSRELSPRTWLKYQQACDLLIGHFGKPRLIADLGPDDFAALRNKMTRRTLPGHHPREAFITHEAPDHGAILLFDPGLVISLVGAGAGEFQLLLLAVGDHSLIDEDAVIIRVDAENRHGELATHHRQALGDERSTASHSTMSAWRTASP